MKALILAAGRGERMRPLTDTCPKPLLEAGGKALIVWHLERLAAAAFKDIVINHAHLGTMIEERLGDGRRWGLRIAYSPESRGALETAGGINNALPLLGADPFLVVNADIWCDWPPEHARARGATLLRRGDLAHLLLVANPPHHPDGDFSLSHDRVGVDGPITHTFAGIGIYAADLFAGLRRGEPARLGPLLRSAAAAGRVGGELYGGTWTDVGTAQRLATLDAELRHAV